MVEKLDAIECILIVGFVCGWLITVAYMTVKTIKFIAWLTFGKRDNESRDL